MAQQSGYLPGIAPPVQDPELQQSLQWAQRELDNISRQFTNYDTVQYNVLHVPPEKPRDGMTVVADGVNWNPGEGPGLYVYQNGAWTKVGGGAAISFRANNNVDQTGLVSATWTQVTLPIVYYDVGGYFSGSRWTPPPGKVHLSGSLVEVPDVASTLNGSAVAITKNGIIGPHSYGAALGGNYAASISVDEIANGTDYFNLMAYTSATVGTGAVLAGYAFLAGHWIGP